MVTHWLAELDGRRVIVERDAHLAEDFRGALGVVYVPYFGRPIRGQVLSLREKEFVDAAVAQGMRAPRIMFGEIMPNLTSTILVFGTLIIANNILLEAALSFLGAGIQSTSVVALTFSIPPKKSATVVWAYLFQGYGTPVSFE